VTVRRHLFISGRVQGVFFRDGCARQARALGVTGWVRNTSDGRVEAAFEGEPESVERIVAWCRLGPGRAMVTGVAVSEQPPQGDTAFRVY
jgi:acylphosphatase